MNLPAGVSWSNIVSVARLCNTFNSNNLTIVPNGSEKIGGIKMTSATFSNKGQSVTLVYVDDNTRLEKYNGFNF